MRVPAAKSSADCVQPWSITIMEAAAPDEGARNVELVGSSSGSVGVGLLQRLVPRPVRPALGWGELPYHREPALSRSVRSGQGSPEARRGDLESVGAGQFSLARMKSNPCVEELRFQRVCASQIACGRTGSLEQVVKERRCPASPLARAMRAALKRSEFSLVFMATVLLRKGDPARART